MGVLSHGGFWESPDGFGIVRDKTGPANIIIDKLVFINVQRKIEKGYTQRRISFLPLLKYTLAQKEIDIFGFFPNMIYLLTCDICISICKFSVVK